MRNHNDLSLSQAIKDGRLQGFIAQSEAAGIGPADEKEAMETLAKTIKQSQSEDLTSRSAYADDSTEK